MGKHETGKSKHRTAATMGMVGLLFALSGLGGCLGNPDDDIQDLETTQVTSAVDRDALDNALLNEREMTEQGYTLEGRVWFQRDVQMSVYTDPAGARVGLMSMRAGSPETLADRSPTSDETFSAYVQRVAAGKTQRPLTELGSSGPNLAVFDAQAASSSADLGVKRSAVIGFEACSSSWFNARCAEWAGLIAKGNKGSITGDWRLTDLRSSNTQSQNDVTGEMAVACSDKGTSTLRVTNTGAAFGPTTGSMEVTLNQGFAQVAFNVAGWKQEEYCKTKVLGVCVDYAFRVKLAHFDSTIRATPSANAEVHFCGKFSKLADYYQGDWACQDTLVCPLQCAPGNASCVR
jgi:hypothetical protein